MDRKTVVIGLSIIVIVAGLLLRRYFEMLGMLILINGASYLLMNRKKLNYNLFAGGFKREYRFSSERDFVTVKEDEQFRSTAVIECFLSSKGIDGNTLEKLTNSIEFELKLVMRVQQVDLSKYTEWLKESRGRLEVQKAKLEDEGNELNNPEIAVIERQSSQINSMMDRIMQGERPMFFRYLVFVDALGRDEKESAGLLNTRLQSARKIIDTLFAGQTRQLRGNELYDAI